MGFRNSLIFNYRRMHHPPPRIYGVRFVSSADAQTQTQIQTQTAVPFAPEKPTRFFCTKRGGSEQRTSNVSPRYQVGVEHVVYAV